MKDIMVDTCLALAVLSVWLGCIGAFRLGSVLDRLHCVTFVNASAGPLIALAAFVEEGATSRTLKLAALVVVTLVTGAATTHATGRSILLRGDPRR